MKFKISLVDNQVEEQLGFNVINYDTAQTLPYFKTDHINSYKVGEYPNGEVKLRYNTGFLPEPISRNKYIDSTEKEVLLKAQLEAKKRLEKELGKDASDEFNKFMWKEKYGDFTLTNSTPLTVFDTTNIDHLILYWQIMSDAYDEIAVNIKHSLLKQSKFFVQESEASNDRDASNESDKVSAFAKLHILQEDGDVDSLLYLCWALGKQNEFMMGFPKGTSKSTMVKALYDFIEGKTKDVGKKMSVREFLDTYAEMKANNDSFMMRTLIKVADYHNVISKNKSNVYVSKRGTELGKTLDEVKKQLSKSQFVDEYREITAEALKALSNES